MLSADIKPYANCIWNFSKYQAGANLIDVDYKTLMLTLLPRTQGTFTRLGLKLNKLRYTNDNYTEKFLSGGNITVAYNPDDVSKVWIIENGKYVEFQLIETQFQHNTLDEIQEIRTKHNSLIRQAQDDTLRAKIALANHIETITNISPKTIDVNIKGIRKTKTKERIKTHIDYMREGIANE